VPGSPKCPECGSEDTVEIVYGYPTHELSEESEPGEVVPGRCCINEDSPDRECRACGHTWQAGLWVPEPEDEPPDA
jgi:hypothetical protein